MSSPSLEPSPDKDIILSTHYIAVIIVITILAVLIVWLRMYTRMFVSRNAGWDDWTMFTASLVTIVTNAFLMEAYHQGLGRHIYYLQPWQISQTFMWLWAAEPTNLFAVFLVRLSISLFFLRLVPPKKVYLWLIWGIIAALTASDIFVSINYFFQCRPIRKVWQPDTPGTCFGHEVTAAAIWLYQAVSIIADIILLLIPIHLFWRLQVQLRTKLVLIFVCCLGIFTCVCAIVKTVLLQNLLGSDPDQTWVNAELCLWAPMELCVGMICGTIPTLRPLLTSWSDKSRLQHGQYRSFEPPHKLSPLGSGSSKPFPRATASPKSTGTTKTSLFSPPSSKEKIIAPQDVYRIRRTFDVEINNEAAKGSDKGRGVYKESWNAV